MIDVGQVYHATLLIANQAIPPATIVLTITLPDGTTLTPSVGTGAASGTGWLLSYDYLTTMAGLHEASWVTTVPGTAAADAFNVRDYRAILSLAEGKTHLGGGPPPPGPATTTNSATSSRPSPKSSNPRSARASAAPSPSGSPTRRPATIVLNQPPVISVTSVTSVWTGGPSWTTAQLVTDADAGTVTIQYGAMPFYWGPWDVVYVAGRAVVPERYIHAAKELLRHLWDTQRGQLQAPALAAARRSPPRQGGRSASRTGSSSCSPTT